MKDIKKLVFLSLFVAMGTALHALEMMLPNLVFVVPGAKLGLANIVTLLIIYLYGLREGLIVSILRVLIVSLICGTFFSAGFFLSLVGSLLSTFVMAVFYKHIRSLSVIGISVIGALFHNIGQLIAAAYILHTKNVFYYLPVILLLSLPTGIFTGYITKMLLQYLKKHSYS